MTTAVRTITTGTVADAIFNNDGTTFYVAQGGSITAYSVATGAQIRSWTIGSAIGGMDVSADGRTLVAAERAPGATDTTNGTHAIKIYGVNLTDGSVTTYSTTTDASYSPYDVVALANGKALISLNETASNAAPLVSLNLGTGAFDINNVSVNRYAARSIFDPAADHTGTTIEGFSPITGEVSVVAETGSITGSGVGFGQYDFRHEAISTAGNLIVGVGASIIKLFDLQFNAIPTPAILNQQFDFGRSVGGLALNAAGTRLYVLDAVHSQVFAFDTSDWHVTRDFSVGDTVTTVAGIAQDVLAYGDRLSISPDGHFLSVIGDNKVALFDLQALPAENSTRYGTTASDTLVATADYPTINSLAGNDVLSDGGVSGATLIGGPGSDRYHLSLPGTVVVESDADFGSDTVYTSLSGTTISPGIEVLTFEPGASGTLFGDARSNGLFGGDGNDILVGGAGNDRLSGGGGNDIAVINVARSTATISVDRIDGSIIVSSSDGIDFLSGVETIRFTDQDISTAPFGIIGTSGNDTLTGSATNDLLMGLDGNDVLSGMAGNDTLDGGLGNDLLDGGDGYDTAIIGATRNDSRTQVRVTDQGDLQVTWYARDIRYGPNAPTLNTATLRNVEAVRFVDLVNLSSDQTVAVSDLAKIGTAGNDALTASADRQALGGLDGNDVLDAGGFSRITFNGGGGNDILIGGPGGDVMVGGAGADTMTGGAGSDTYYVDNPGDVVVEGANAGHDTIFTSIDYTLPANVEELRSAPETVGPLTLIGNDGNNGIYSDNGGSIYGLGGDDSLDPGLTAPSYVDGGAGNDSVYLHASEGSAIPTFTFAPNGDIVVHAAVVIRLHDVEELDISIPGGSFIGIYTGYMAAIRARYLAYGGREPTADEYTSWSTVLHNGVPLADFNEAILTSSLGKAYIDQQIGAAYRTYGGRAPTADELAAWEGAIGTSQNYAMVRNAILSTSLGRFYVDQQISAAYQTYGGRAPTAAEISAWEGAIGASQNYGMVKNAILSTSLGRYYVDQQINAAYQSYGGRAATADELAAWAGVIGTSQNYGVVKNAILSTSLGHFYVDQQISAAYQTYGGRAPTSAEISAWEGAIGSSQNYGMVKNAILSTSLGQAYTDAQITAAYQTYGGRAPTPAEISAWEGAIGSSQNYAMVKNAILSTSLGQPYTDAQITAAYQTYGGRAPIGNELQVWEGVLNGNGHDVSIVRNAILSTSLGQAYTDAQITALYQTYGGRAPIGNELQVWESVLNGNAHDFSVLRNAILSTPMGDDNSSLQIAGLYQRYFLRAPTIFEQDAWHGVIKGGADFDALRDVLMSDGGSAASTTQLTGTTNADTFHFGSTPYLAISGFDPAHDVIDLSGMGYASIDPIDAAHASQIHQIDGTPDVLITLDANHEILLHNVTLAQLGSADFLL